MSIMSDAPTPPSGFPRSLMYYIQYPSYLGNPLGCIFVSNRIDIAQNDHLSRKNGLVYGRLACASSNPQIFKKDYNNLEYTSTFSIQFRICISLPKRLEK